MEYPNYSVLMSVYKKENPTFLRESMMSIYNQTVPTNDFVLVCDGPLTDELEAVIQDMQKLFLERLFVCRLVSNRGLGLALNEGLKHCKNDYVARMDSDDISRTNRCEQQLKVFMEKPSVSIVSGIVEEFANNVNRIDARRIVPENQEEIIEFAKKRNPFNHPCVMYKKSAVEKVGSYQDFYLLEDYYLWIRMLLAGCKGYNLQHPLLWMRAGSAMYNRRSGIAYVKSQIELFNYMRKNTVINNCQFVVECCTRIIGSMIPNKLRRLIYKYNYRG